MASAGGLGWPPESRRPDAAGAGSEPHGEPSGLGWPRRSAGPAPGGIRRTGADEEREALSQVGGQVADPAPERVRRALSAAVSRETSPDGPAPSDGQRRRDDVTGAGQGGGGPAAGVDGARLLTADRPASAAEAALATLGGSGQQWPRPHSCRLITIANQKGGVGKTTTAVNLAASLALHGARVLVIDLDPQGNASTALDIEHRAGTRSVYNVLVDDQGLAGIVRPVTEIPGLFCAPATIDLAGAEIELVPLVAREARLSRALSDYDTAAFDYIFIDCPPSLGLLTVNALVAAAEVLIPIQCEYYALEGLEQLLRTIDLVRSHLNPALYVSTILLTMYDGRTRLASQVAEEVRDHFGDVVLGAVIPRSVRVSEAPSYGQSVMTYDPGSSGAQAYLEAAREVADRAAQLGRLS
jgi:chromosome partitioning protein